MDEVGGLPVNPILKLAAERWKTSSEAESENRKNMVEAVRFYMGEQWPQQVMQSRTLSNRPCLTINLQKKFVRQVTNDMRMNRPSVKVIPVKDSSEETADILEGMVRHIQVASNADIAYDTAGQNQVIGGLGYFRVLADYEDETSFDQVIRIHRIKNPLTVYYDPNCVEPDYSDARYCFIVEDMPREEFKKRYPEASAANANMTSTGDEQKDWADEKTVRVAEYFAVEEKEDVLCLMMDGTTMLKSEMKGEGYKEAKEAGFIKRERDTTTRKVMWRKITFCDILEGGQEGQEWPGKYIPVIPVLGEDMDVNGKRIIQGMIADTMDPQRQFNYMSTAMTEAAALAPKSPWLIAAGQLEGFERFWESANTQAFSHLPYNPQTVDGFLVPPPARNTAEAPIAAFGALVAKASDDLKGTTGIYDAGLGNRSNETSGKAIMARQKEGDVANFNYMDNLSRAITYLGKILLDLIPKIYDAPRIIQITQEDETVKSVAINQPVDDEGKPLPEGTDASLAKIYDLSAGKYDVAVVVGPSFTTKRQESVDAMLGLAQTAPGIVERAGDLLVKAMDFPLAQEIGERLVPPDVKEQEKSKIPPQVSAQMQQMGQMVEMLTQEVNNLKTEKEQKVAELASKEKMNAENNETKLIIEAMKQEMTANLTIMQQQLSELAATQAHARQVEMVEMQPKPVDGAQPVA